jgi:hypothetical protein
VQVLVLGFDEPNFTGEPVAELTRLREQGIVRLLDVLLVTRTADGSLETLDSAVDTDADLGGLAAALFTQPENGDEPAASEAAPDGGQAGSWSLEDAVPAGGVAAIALIEHLWAQPLAEAVRRAGGRTLDETWLAPGDLALLDTLMSQRRNSAGRVD